LLKYLFLLFNLLCLYLLLRPVFQPLPVPAVARIGAYGSLHPNALHSAANQAALGAVKTAAAALYGEKRFLLQELALYHFALAQPAGAGAFGLQAVFAGNSDYSTSKVGVAYGMPLSPKVAIGVQFDYLAHRIRGYGNAAQVAAEGGCWYTSPNLFMPVCKCATQLALLCEKVWRNCRLFIPQAWNTVRRRL
jgi:hypothetical protein